jgi:hypothetical protein
MHEGNRAARIAKIRAKVTAHMPVEDRDVLWLVEELEALQHERFQLFFDVDRLAKQIDKIVGVIREDIGQ